MEYPTGAEPLLENGVNGYGVLGSLQSFFFLL